MNEKIRRFLVVMAVIATATSCTLYEHCRVEELHPPQIDQDSIIVPDWDSNNIQQ